MKVLKLTKVWFWNSLLNSQLVNTEDDIKKILPDCNVEIKECEFHDLDESSDDYDSDNSWDVSFDDGEQNSNSYEGVETIYSLVNLFGEEN